MSAEQPHTKKPAGNQPARHNKKWQTALEHLSYKGIVGNVPFLLYAAVLVLLYISNSNHAVQVQKELNQQNVILKELRWKHMDIKSKLVNAGTEKDILRRGASVGLQPLRLPPYQLSVDTLILSEQ